MPIRHAHHRISTEALRAVLSLTVLLALLLAPVAGADLPPSKLARAESNPHLLKVSSDLLTIRAQQASGRSLDEAIARFPAVPRIDDRIVVEVRLEEAVAGPVIDLLEQEGLTVTAVHARVRTVIGEVAPAELHRLAALSEVRLVRPSYPPRVMGGATTSQGDSAIRTDLARSSIGIDGAGVRVGIVSDSFARTPSVNGSKQPSNPEICPLPTTSSTLTGAQGQVSGDLPTEVHLLDDCDSLSTNCTAVRDEGAALGEIIHDLAPGAELVFHSGFNSRQDFAEGIDELTACGADVIVDDLLYLVEPMFQDGLIAQAVDRAADAGIPYFASAGNQASFGISESFDDFSSSDEEDDLPSGIDFHHFADSGDPFAAVTVPAGCGFTAVLQWNEPFDVPLGSGAATDLDLYVCEGEGGGAPDLPPFHPSDDPCQIYSQDAQGCGAGMVNGGLGDPVEIVDYLNAGPSAKTVYLAVDHYCGDTNGDFQEDDAVDFRIVTFGFGCNLSDPGYQFEAAVFDQPQIYGHGAAEGASAVGSVFYSEIETNGLTDPPFDRIDVEPYSSTGGTLPIYFDDTGSPIPGGPESRLKPDLAAPDGVNTTFFGSDIGTDPDPFPNFFGSSAAAPHAAGVAALMLEANPFLTRDELTEVIATTALDIESPGWDAQSGDGLVDGLEAVTLARPDSSISPSSHTFGSAGVGDSVTQIFTLTNDTEGPAALWVSAMNLSDPANFSLDTAQGPEPCGSEYPNLPPGDQCTFAVSFTPTATGSYDEALDVLTNGNGSLLSLSASSVAASVEVDIAPTPATIGEPGGMVTYVVAIENQSAATDPVTIDSLVDLSLGILDGVGTCSLPQQIAPAATYGCSYSAPVAGNAGSMVGRQVTANGQDDDAEGVSDVALATVTITDSAPGLAVSLASDPDTVTDPGEWVTFHVEIENISAQTDPVTIQSLVDDVAGDPTDAANPLVADSTCQTGAILQPGDSYLCSYRSEVSGRAGQAPTRAITTSALDDEGSVAEGIDSATITVVAPTLFSDGFESGDLSAWSAAAP